MKDLIKSLLGILLVALIGYAIGLGSNAKRIRLLEESMSSWTDSVKTVDILDFPKPVPKDSTVIHHIYVKMPVVPAPNVSVPAPNVSSQDSALVSIPIERKVYQEDSLYRAVISGHNCNLDSLTIYSTTKTITVHEKSKNKYKPYSWTLFPQAEVNYGAGALEMKASIGADIAISENRRLRFVPEVGYRALQFNDQMLKGCYVGGKIKYNLIQVK